MSDATATQKLIVENIARAVAKGLQEAFGGKVDVGVKSRYEDREVTRRALPLRAAIVEFDGQLNDCIVGISSMDPELLEPALAAAGDAIGQHLGVSATVTVPAVQEFEERDQALEELDALWNEPTVHFQTRKGELLLVVGRWLVESMEKLGLDLQPDVQEAAPGGAAQDGTDVGTDVAPPAAHPAAAGDPMHAPAEAAHEPMAAAHASAGAGAGDLPHHHVAAAPKPAATHFESAASQQWAELLSGVDVEVTAELGRTNMALGDLASLGGDRVITLDQMVDEPVTVYVNGSLYARARLVVVDNEYGIEIVEVVERSAAAFEHLAAA